HSHRAAGYVVGCCTIVLTIALLVSERRRWLAWLGGAVLLGVCVQGVLGGFRVVFDRLMGPSFAIVHGCFAQVVAAGLVSTALFTSKGWLGQSKGRGARASVRLRRLSLLTVSVVYAQIILGAVLRQTYSSLGQRGHLLVAFAVLAAVAWLVK